MRSVKFLLAAVILLSLSREATAQYVQPMRYDHYSVTQQMNVGAGVVRTTNASAYLEIGPTSGGNKGLLIPRLSTTERDAISTPATGLLIFNTTTGTFNFYTGSAWSAITSGSSTGISQLGNSGNWGLTRVNDSTYRVDSMAVMTKYQSEKTRDSLLALIGAKLNISDTANKWLSSIYRKTGTDSVFKVIGGTHIFAFKDSIGAGGGSTDTSVLIGDTLYTRILKRISDDSARVRSIRLQLNGVTVTPTETDSTASWNIQAITQAMLDDTAAAIRADFPAGGGGSPAGNYGNVQVNRNGAFATPASDSLDFDAGLSIKGSLTVSSLTSGRIPIISTSGLITDDAKFTFSLGSYPQIMIGGPGDSYGTLALRDNAGTLGYINGNNGLTLYGSTSYDQISFYDYAGGTQMANFRNTGVVNSFSFYNGRAAFNYLTPGLSDGTVHIEGSVGDSTTLTTDANTHASRVITRLYANATSSNNFYGSLHSANTNVSASQNHGAIFQSDFKKTGNHTLVNMYHHAILGDSIISGIVNNRYGVIVWDAVKISGTLGVNNPINIAKLKAGISNFGVISDSSQLAWLDGNILLGDSLIATSARKTIHFFNGTAPSSNISGAILYAESGELKVRDASGNVQILSDPAAGSGTVTSVATNTGTGITGGTITTTGTIAADTLLLATRAIVQHRIDSLAGTIGSGITGTGTVNQMAFFDGTSSIKSSNAFVASDALYPSFQVGGTGTNEGTILVKDPAGTTGGISGSNGFAAFGSSSYKRMQFFSHSGGSLFFEMLNNTGVLTADFQSGVAVTIASTLQVNTTVKQAGTAASLSGYMNTNSGSLASTTNLNPGILVYNGGNNPYGMDIGYNSSRYATRIFAPTGAGISFGRMATGATLQSNYTESMYLNGSGNLGIGDATPASMLTVGSGDLFQVNSSGNIIKINNVTTSFPSSQGAANTVWQNDGSGNLSSYTITAGTQTPTATNGTNVSASTPGQEQYTRVGNVVTVSGYIDISCTSANTASDIDLSLPVASAFTTTTQLSGVIVEAVTGVASPGHGTISSNSTNDRVTISFTPRATGSLSYRYTYSYQIL